MHCQNSQSKVIYQFFFDVSVVDVLVAEFRGEIIPDIPEVIAFLSDRALSVHQEGDDTLTKISEQGKVPNCPT